MWHSPNRCEKPPDRPSVDRDRAASVYLSGHHRYVKFISSVPEVDGCIDDVLHRRPTTALTGAIMFGSGTSRLDFGSTGSGIMVHHNK